MATVAALRQNALGKVSLKRNRTPTPFGCIRLTKNAVDTRFQVSAASVVVAQVVCQSGVIGRRATVHITVALAEIAGKLQISRIFVRCRISEFSAKTSKWEIADFLHFRTPSGFARFTQKRLTVASSTISFPETFRRPIGWPTLPTSPATSCATPPGRRQLETFPVETRQTPCLPMRLIDSTVARRWRPRSTRLPSLTRWRPAGR